MGYQETLRRLKYGALASILFMGLYLLVNYYVIDLPGWILSAGLVLVSTLTISPIFRPSKAKSKEDLD